MLTPQRLDEMERVYSSVIPGVLDSVELADMRRLIAELRVLTAEVGRLADQKVALLRALDAKGRQVRDAKEVARMWLWTGKKTPNDFYRGADKAARAIVKELE